MSTALLCGTRQKMANVSQDANRRLRIELTSGDKEHAMCRLSAKVKRGEYREILFWLLLLGSWQFLASTGGRNGAIGVIGTATFLVFAGRNLDRLRSLGFQYAQWRSAAQPNWAYAIVSGVLAGVMVYAIGSASGQSMGLSANWKLVTLQVTLGPVLEEVVFRGYLFAFLIWLFRKIANEVGRKQLAVTSTAVVFALVHLAQPGVSWLQFACIASTGTLYGWIRYRSASTVPAAVSHATYNLTLYLMAGATLLGGNAYK